MKFRNRILHLTVQRIDMITTHHGLFYEDGGFIFNSYDCSVIYRGAEGEVLEYV